MEENVWSDPEVFKILNNDIILVSLYVDDRTKLKDENQFSIRRTNGSLKKIKTIGQKWSTFQYLNFKTASQPFYVLMTYDGEILNEPIQYADKNVFKNLNLEIKKEDFKLSTSINWSKNTNEVTDLFGTETINLSPGASVSSRAIVGEQLGVLFGTGSQTNPDGSLLLDENGFPQITPSPIILGDPNPDWRAGLGLNLNYKKLSLNVVVEHSEGGDFMPRTLWVLHRFGTTTATSNRVTLSQDLVNYRGNTISSGTTVRGDIRDFGAGPVLLDENWYRTGIGGGFGDNQAYNFGVYDATFTKVRELSLSYLFDGNGLDTILGLDSILLTATARNLININNVPGIDPETNQYGVGNALGLDYFTNPQTKSVLFTAAFNF